MKRFLRNGLLFCALGAALLALVNAAAAWRDPSFPAARLRRARLVEERSDCEALVVGNSHAQAIHFETLGVDGYYLHRGGLDLIEAEYVLRSVVDELPELRTVLLPISFFAFHRDNGLDTGISRAHFRREAYAAFNTWSWRPGELRLWLQARLAHLVRPDRGEGLILGTDAETREEVAGIEPDGREWKRAVDFDESRLARAATDGVWHEDLAHHASIRVGFQLDPTRAVVETNPDIAAENERVLERIAELLAGEGIELVLFTPPYYRAYLREFEDWGEGFGSELMTTAPERAAAIAARHANVVYFDHSHDNDFRAQPRRFRDSDHVSSRGAEQYSELLRRELVAAGKLSD